MAIIIEDWHNSSLLSFIKSNSKVTLEQIKEAFPTDEEVVNLNNLIDEEIEKLIAMGKIQFIDGYYSVCNK